MWATFNEVNVQTFCSYIYGSFPPAKFFNFGTAGLVFLHMYQAHIEAYHVIKGLEGDCLDYSAACTVDIIALCNIEVTTAII